MLPGCLLGVDAGARALTFLEGAGALRFGLHSMPWITAVVESSYALMLSFVAWNYWRHGGAATDVLQYVRPGPLSRVRFGPVIDLPGPGLPSVSAPLIAFIGLGLMGRPMAKNLLKAGYPVVVHSRSRGPVDDLVSAGARAATSPADVARQATRIITMVPALIIYAVIPFGPEVSLFGREVTLYITDINVGLLYIVSVASVGVYGIILAGYSSNSKYPLLASLRASAPCPALSAIRMSIGCRPPAPATRPAKLRGMDDPGAAASSITASRSGHRPC